MLIEDVLKASLLGIFFLAVPSLSYSTWIFNLRCSMWDLYLQYVGSSPPDQGWNAGLLIGSTESKPLNHQGSSYWVFFFNTFYF